MTTADHAFAATLELYYALFLTEHRSELGFAWWQKKLSVLHARERRIVILHGLCGMFLTEVAERLELTRSRADQLWRRALTKIKNLAEELHDDLRMPNLKRAPLHKGA